VYRSADSDSESDAYVGARRNIPTKKQRQRQHAVAAGREPPSQAEVRFSARRTAQVANYNDEEDEDEFVEDDDEMISNYYANASEETGPVIDKVLDHKPKEGIGTLHIRSLCCQLLTDIRTRRRKRVENRVRLPGKRS
jgi:chromodomain-helicase-DNA-binding protein 1